MSTNSENETSAERRQDNGGAHTPIAWLRDAHKGEGDECLVPASEGDPGAFAVYTELVVDDLLKDRRDLLEALKASTTFLRLYANSLDLQGGATSAKILDEQIALNRAAIQRAEGQGT